MALRRSAAWERASRVVALGLWLSQCPGAAAQGHHRTKHFQTEEVEYAKVSVLSPDSVKGDHLGLFATFSSWPLPEGDFEAWVPPRSPYGCAPYVVPKAMSGGRSGIAVVRRGNCTFLKKALIASTAGAAGLMVVDDTVEPFPCQIGNSTKEERESQDVDIFVVSVGKPDGDAIISSSQQSADTESPGPPVILSVAVYRPSFLDPSEAILVCLATLLVAIGAQFSTSDLKEKGTLSKAMQPPDEEVLDIDMWTAVGFCVTGSCFLVLLFFLMKYLIYVIIFAFCMGGASCIGQIVSIILQHFNPHLSQKAMTVPFVGLLLKADVIAALPAVTLPACWLFLRNTHYGWPFQDIIGAGFLCWLQRTLRLPDMKIATLLLVLMFFFDIFWVFISPLLFQGKSVMVHVATGGGTGESVPMLLRLPSLLDSLGNDRLLGFGDIALPGLLVSYLRRHDLLSKRSLCRGYFFPALIGYFFGLCATICALVIMEMGQPALLYLVPGTLGTTLFLSLCRGEFRYLWEGRASPLMPSRVDDDDDDDSGEDEDSGIAE